MRKTKNLHRGSEALHVAMDESYDFLLANRNAALRAATLHGLRRGLETALQVLDALRQRKRWTWAPGEVDGKVGKEGEMKEMDEKRAGGRES